MPEEAKIEEREKGIRLVTLLFSAPAGDVYKLPAHAVDLWLSVQVYDRAGSGPNGVFSVNAVQTADAKAWRRAYRNWPMIRPGPTETRPANDPLVLDYLTAKVSSEGE
jgi:hypothetical protein